MKLIPIIIIVILTLFSQNINADYYTSIRKLYDLLEAETRVISFFEDYMDAMETISSQIEEELEKLSNKTDYDPKELYKNPLAAYKIISRFVINWKNLNKTTFNEEPSLTYITNLKDLVDLEGYELPTITDLAGASKGLARLQRTYKQETYNVADGNLMDKNYAEKMTASECYRVGHSLYEAGNFKYAAEWLLQARIRLATELKSSNGTLEIAKITDIQILESLAPTMFHLGNTKLALYFNSEILVQDENNKIGLENKANYTEKAREDRYSSLFGNSDEETQQLSKLEKLFEQVCNGDVQQTPREKRSLRCRFVHNNVPFRYLMPFKKEELNYDPPVAYYHQFILDSEIDGIFNESKNSLKRSKVGLSETPELSDIRTSQNTWVYRTGQTFFKTLSPRLKDVTGLNIETAEPLQVVNYGIGGHYGPHHDFSEDPTYTFDGRGNRILTALIFMNDVEQGGSTAFPYLKLAVPPIEGSMVVWDNLHKSLEPDYRTKHGGCPLLIGSKWICNEWFHEKSQEFTRPCDLENDGYKSEMYKN